MLATDDIQRHPDGSIDYAAYRRTIAAQPRRAFHDPRAVRKAFAGVLLTAAILGSLTLLALTPPPQSSGEAMAQGGSVRKAHQVKVSER